MQLAGPGAFEPPRDPDATLGLPSAAVAKLNAIDATSEQKK